MRSLKASMFFDDLARPLRLYQTTNSEAAGWHSHEFTEFAIVLKGQGYYDNEFEKTLVQAGDVLITPAGALHGYRQEKDILLVNVLFQFDKLPIPLRDLNREAGFIALFRADSDYFRALGHFPRLRLDHAELARTRLLLKEALALQQSKAPGALLSVYGAFLQLLPILLQAYLRSEDAQFPPPAPQCPDRLAECLDYMAANHSRRLAIPDLAKRAGMGHATFTRHFRAATGETPMAFLVRLRLEDAMHYLASGMNVTMAAAQAGFDDSNYFTRLFRRHFGAPPSRYQKALPPARRTEL